MMYGRRKTPQEELVEELADLCVALFWLAVKGVVFFGVDCVAAQLILLVVGGLGFPMGFWSAFAIALVLEFIVGIGAYVGHKFAMK